ncbi:hypothetical protein PS1_005757 [Malus domestica]
MNSSFVLQITKVRQKNGRPVATKTAFFSMNSKVHGLPCGGVVNFSNLDGSETRRITSEGGWRHPTISRKRSSSQETADLT